MRMLPPIQPRSNMLLRTRYLGINQAFKIKFPAVVKAGKTVLTLVLKKNLFTFRISFLINSAFGILRNKCAVPSKLALGK